jgi:two-component system cell cycle response regulator
MPHDEIITEMEKPEKIDYGEETMLIVDDDSNLRETLVNLLSYLGFNIGSAGNGPDALKELEQNPYTFMLTDMKMPEMDGLELIKRVKEAFPDVSIISMTGFSEGYSYIDVINTGASDFIKKPFEVEELEAKVRRIINERNLRMELSRLSITDSLTGLFNQRYFYRRLDEEVLRAQRQKHHLGLIIMDLDNFKAYNDTHGHLAGDDVLRKVGHLINTCVREGVDSGYRYGGDEFAIILIDAGWNVAKGIGERIQQAFSEDGDITASLGYTIYSDGMSFKDLVAAADKNLYKAKDVGKKSAADNV